MQKVNKAVEPPGEARPDWQIVSPEERLPDASVYLDVSGRFALNRPEYTPADAWSAPADLLYGCGLRRWSNRLNASGRNGSSG